MSDIRPRAPELELVEPGSPDATRAVLAGWNRTIRMIGEAAELAGQHISQVVRDVMETLLTTMTPPTSHKTHREPDPRQELLNHIMRVNAGNRRRQARRKK